MPRMNFGGDKPAGRYGNLFSNMGSYAESETPVEEVIETVAEETVEPAAPPAPQAVPTVEVEMQQAAEEVEATEEQVLAALQSKLNAPTSTTPEDEAPEPLDTVDEEEETEFEAEPSPANEEDAIETTYGYDPGVADEDEGGVSYTAPEEPISSTSFDESDEEATIAEVPGELVDADEEASESPMTEPSEAPITHGVVALIVSLYEAISPLESNELEALNILLGNHTDTGVVEIIESIISDTNQTKSLLDTVTQLSAVDTSDSTKAAVRYTMLLFRYDETTLRNLATILGVDGLGDDASTEDIVETLATTLASTPAAVFNVAKTINSIIP